MSCPHSDNEATCPRCAATREAEAAGAPTIDDVDGHTLVREGTGAETAPHGVGARIGRYVVLDVLGAGGMGLVYAAYDPVLDRRVAIKVLRASKSKGSHSTGATNRLLREAQAMAQLSHPHVVPVYDVGSEGASVFVAMELVRGVTLATWLKEKPRGWRDVLSVFLGAGRGLLAAHQAGLVHRDFKPTNVLMGEDGRARVTDFGLARSTRSTSTDDPGREDTGEHSGPISLETPLTEVGAVMGSPGYMAPEQYDGADTSPATDQYSFCVSLYEALYGKRPFAGESLQALARLARAADVPPPPKGSTVPAWLFPVLRQGMAARPEERHASMAVLLDALSKDPARVRNRLLVGAAALVTVTAATLSWGWASQTSARECRASSERLADAWNDEAREKARAAFTATGRSFAQVAWTHASEALDTYARDWVAARVDACEATRVRGEQSEAQLALRLSCLDRRLDELRTLATTFAAADAELVGVAPDATARLTPLAGCANLKALEARARLAPSAQEQVARLEQQLSQGRVLIAAGRLAQARAQVEPAVAAADTLAVPAFQAEALQVLGHLELESARYREARAAWQEAARLALEANEDASAAQVLASLVSLVGWRLERPDEGLTLAALARGVLARLGGDRRTEVALDEAIGDAHWQGGNRPEALASYRRALEAAMALTGPTSNDVARLRSSIGWVLMEQGHLSEARREYEVSRTIRERNLGAEHPSLGATWNELGSLASQEGNFAAAVVAYERSRVIYEQSLGPTAFQVTRAHLNTAEDLALGGRVDEAVATLARGAANLSAEASPPPSGRMQLARIRARVALAKPNALEALTFANEAVQIAEQQYGARHPDTATCLLVRAEAQAAAGRGVEAIATWERYLSMAAELDWMQTRDTVNALVHLGATLTALRRAPEAVPRLEQALALLERVEANERLRCDARLGLAEALAAAGGDLARAQTLAREAQHGYVEHHWDDGRARAEAWLDAHR